MHCRLCDSNRLLSVLDLGATPPCEAFLTADELDAPETTFPLHLRVCEDCLLLQIPALITPEDTFTEYAYFSSYSDSWVQHAQRFVDDVIERLGLKSDSFVIEVASNDGYLLQHAVAAGIPCLGIEPSGNVGVAARDNAGRPGRLRRTAGGVIPHPKCLTRPPHSPTQSVSLAGPLTHAPRPRRRPAAGRRCGLRSPSAG